MISLRNVLYAGAIAVSATILAATWKAHESFGRKITQQAALNSKVLMFKESYKDLQTVNGQWEKTYPSITEELDILRLHRLMALDKIVPTSPDTLVVRHVEKEGDNPMYRTCMQNSPKGFSFNVHALSDGFAVLEKIADRPDLRFSQITFEVNEQPDLPPLSVTMDTLCLLMRYA